MLSDVMDSHSRGKVKSSFNVDPDDLLRGHTPAEFAKYISQYDLDGTVDSVRYMASQLPDRAAISYPGNTLLYGGGSGSTTLTIKTTKTSDPMYAQVRRADNNQLIATAFILPGKGVKIRVNLASYVVVFGTGKYWYGETDLFGDLGYYQKSNPISVDSNRYRYTYTIGISNGNHGSTNATRDDFR